MTQRGTHTWDIVVAYHRCPECGYIIESREDFLYRSGKYQKEVECPRCHRQFTLTKKYRVRPGPFFGEADHIEITWSS